MRRPCPNCGTPTRAGQPCQHCGAGGLTHDDATYRRNRRLVLANATHCHLCGQPFQPGDAIEVDHIVPVANGGSHAVSNLAAAHERCNKTKGAN